MTCPRAGPTWSGGGTRTLGELWGHARSLRPGEVVRGAKGRIGMGCPLAEGGSHFPPKDPRTVPCPLTGCLRGGRVLSSGWCCRTATGVFSQAVEASSSNSFLLGTHDSGVCLEWGRVAASSQDTLPPGGSCLGLCGHCMASLAVGRLSALPAPFPQGLEVIPPQGPAPGTYSRQGADGSDRRCRGNEWRCHFAVMWNCAQTVSTSGLTGVWAARRASWRV